VHSGQREHRDVLRAGIVLAAAAGTTNAVIARALGVGVDTVRKWRRRFSIHGLDGLTDQPRSGRPRQFAARVVAEVKALACELPADAGVPLAKWNCPDLAAEAARRGIVTAVSASTVALAARRRAQAVAAPLVDLPPRPVLRVQGTRALDLYARVRERATRRRRLRYQR